MKNVYSVILVSIMLLASCDYAKRQTIAPEYNPFSMLGGNGSSEQNQKVSNALDKYPCRTSRIDRVMTYRLATKASQSSNYVSPWHVVSTMGGSIQEIFFGVSRFNDLLVVSRVKVGNEPVLYATVFFCAGKEDDADRQFLNDKAFLTHFYTTPTVGLHHNERNCQFNGASANTYSCLDDSAFSLENSPPCPPGLEKINTKFQPICH